LTLIVGGLLTEETLENKIDTAERRA